MLNPSMKEVGKHKVISVVEKGYLKVKEASGILGVSERQVQEIKGAREEK